MPRVDKEVIPKQYRSIAKAKNNAQKGEMLLRGVLKDSL